MTDTQPTMSGMLWRTPITFERRTDLSVLAAKEIQKKLQLATFSIASLSTIVQDVLYVKVET
jgi:hypothetical protein